MGVSLIKKEIEKIIFELPEETLPEVLDYLKQVKNSNAEQVKLSMHLRKILTEDYELLKKLAQ